jgi:hypothetical protein
MSIFTTFCHFSLADSNNKNLGNTPAEIQRNQNLINSNNQDYAEIDKSKGEDFLFLPFSHHNLTLSSLHIFHLLV